MPATTCHPASIIRAPRGVQHERFANGDTSDIIRVILEADAVADRTINTKEVDCLRGENKYATLNNVWRFVKYNNRYIADKGHQKIKTPAALFHSGTGDCKSYSVAVAALLRALGFSNIRYRFAAYAPGPYTHVYVVCTLNGKTVVIDPVFRSFDGEEPYERKKDIPATGQSNVSINGLPDNRVNGPISSFVTLGAVGLVTWIIYELTR